MLVTNQDNQNIMQSCIISQHLAILNELLDYGLDPNRGSSALVRPTVNTIQNAKKSKSSSSIDQKSDSKDDLTMQKKPQQQSDNATSNTNSLLNLPKTSIHTLESASYHICSDNGLEKSNSISCTDAFHMYDTPLLLACCLFNSENIDFFANYSR